MANQYNRKTLYLASGNDTLKLALEDTQTTLKFHNSVANPGDALPFLIEGPGQTIVQGHSLTLTESQGTNKLEVGVNDVKATTGTNSLTLDSTGLILQDGVWTTGKNLGSFTRTTSTTVTNISDQVSTNKGDIGNLSASVHDNVTNWTTYKNGLNLNEWTAGTISTKFVNANSNHTTLSTHVYDFLTVPKDELNADQTLQAYVDSKVNAEKDRIDAILANAPESLNTLNELKIALESSDYSLVDVQISIVQKLNALADVVAYLTSEDPTLDTTLTTIPQPTWYASINVPNRDSVDQPAVTTEVANEEGPLVG